MAQISTTEATLTVAPAELVFTEAPRGGSWRGRLLNPDAIDLTDYRRYRLGWGAHRNERPWPGALPKAYYRAEVYEVDQTATGGGIRYQALMQGAHTSSRRHATFSTLSEAQAWLIKWAARRFAVIVASTPVAA